MDRNFLDELLGLGEAGLTLGTGAVAGAVGMPYGLFKGITGGGYGTRKGVEQAQREAQAFMERNTYQPRTEAGQGLLQSLGKAMEESKLPPVLPEAMMLASIPRAAAAAQAERLGMAAEKSLEAPLQRVYDKGGLPREMLLAMGQNTVSPATVFHGSPHRFNKFDSSKIGTGEGAQAFGHGLYLAEAPGVAKDYQQKLSSAGSAKNLASQFGGIDEGLAEAQRRVNRYKEMVAKGDGNSERAKSFLRISEKNLQDLQAMKQGLPENTGYLYQVDLPDEQIARMMDWDKPISQQPKVMRALRKEAESRVKSRLLPEIENELRSKTPLQSADDGGFLSLFNDSNAGLNKSIQEQAQKRLSKMNLKSEVERELDLMKPADMTWDMSGKNFYETMTKRQGSDVNVSKMLAKQNIPGIRYLDEGSRANFRVQNTVKGNPYGEPVSFMTERQAQEYAKEQAAKGFGTQTLPGTSNFVVFPGMEDMLRIEQINNQPVESLFRSLGR